MKSDISGVVVSIVGLPLLWCAVSAGWLNWLIIICVLGAMASGAVLLIGIVGHALIKWAQHI